MLTLHCNPLSDVKSLSKLYHSFTDQQWPAVLCIATIRAWIEDAPDLLEKLVASPTPTPSGGKRKRDWRARKWQARKDTILDQILKEARNDSALENSTWRYLYLNGNDITPDITPVLILGVTYAEWKATRKGSRQPKDDKNSEDNVDGGDLTNNADDRNSKDNVDNVPKSKLNPEQLFRSWAPAAQKLFHETCKGVKIPVEIAREIKRIHAEETEKRSKGLK